MSPRSGAPPLRRSKIGARALLVSLVPLSFLVVLLALALLLQSRSAMIAERSQHAAVVLSGTERATQLVDRADASVTTYALHGRKESALAPYRAAMAQLPATLAGIVDAVRSNPPERRRAVQMAGYFERARALLQGVVADVRAGDLAKAKRRSASPAVARLNTELLASIAAVNEGERAAAGRRVRQIDRQIQAFTIALVALCVVGILVTIWFSLRFGLGISRRIGRLGENARLLASGKATEPIEGDDEIAQLDVVYHEMTRRIASEHDRASELQRALLPQALPELPGIRLDAAYRPASEGGGIGGDWYDVFRIGEHTIGISIGDVAGHGLQAAALMGTARQAIRTVAYIDEDPATVITQVNRALCRNEDGVMVTALFATFDLLDGALRYCFGGHPGPMLVRTGGSVEMLPGKGMALGIAPTAEFETLSSVLDIGSALVFYTDGIVEVERDYFRGLSNLQEAIEDEYRDASQNIAEAIQNRVFARSAPADDSALLFLGVTALGVSALQPKRRLWHIDARIEKSARRVKRALLWHLGEIAGDGADLYASEVVVSELLGNVARHTPGPAEITLEWKGEAATLSVFDRGRPFELPPEDAVAEVLAESGRGLILLRALSREFRVEWRGEGNCVTAVLPLTVRPNAPAPDVRRAMA